MIPWKEVTITDGECDFEHGDYEHSKALREFEREGTMDGYWACSAQELEEFEGDPADAGIQSEDIDFSGMALEQVAKALEETGYTNRSSSDDKIRISVAAPEDDDDSDLDTIREIVGAGFVVTWCGEGHTDGRTQITYEDISITEEP